jgi:hypothetical protein
MTGFNIREKIERNVTIWLLGTLLTGFLAGVGVYRTVQDMAGLKVVSTVDLANSKRQLDELQQKLVASEKRAATASAQLKQAYWAIRGTKISIIYVERDLTAADEIKERLATLGAIVTLNLLDRRDSTRAGKLYYGESSREAAMQIKALVSDIASPYPEDNVNLPSDAVSLWLEHK